LSTVVAVLLLAVLLAVVVVVVSAPLRAARAEREGRSPREGRAEAPEELDPQAGAQRDELEAARQAKYREIRDSELDYRTGKLSQQDYHAIDFQLRAEALEILNRLERFDRGAGGEPAVAGEASGEPQAEEPGAEEPQPEPGHGPRASG
jgi:flagellar biosynthesis/type III secretory pathway M-ring protein FliF/YscJ